MIFHQGALGDFIVTWPIAMAAARIYPQSRVFYVTSSEKGALAEKMLRVESADAEGGWHALFCESPALPERATRLLEGAHTIITFVASADDLWTANVRAIAPESAIVHLSTKPPDDFAEHITQFLIDQLRSIPVLHAAAGQMRQFTTSTGIGTWSPQADAPIVIHPGSGAARKCWPIDRFIDLAESIAKQRRVSFVIGEAERANWPSDQIRRLEAIAMIAEPATYVALRDVIANAATYIGNDSGPTHLAAACGVPTIALFGGDPARWSPLGPRVKIIHRAAITDITVQDVKLTTDEHR